jgi:hypothetical protein
MTAWNMSFLKKLIMFFGLATGYGLDDRGVGIRVPVAKVKFSLYRPWRPLVLREVEATTFSDI